MVACVCGIHPIPCAYKLGGFTESEDEINMHTRINLHIVWSLSTQTLKQWLKNRFLDSAELLLEPEYIPLFSG